MCAKGYHCCLLRMCRLLSGYQEQEWQSMDKLKEVCKYDIVRFVGNRRFQLGLLSIITFTASVNTFVYFS